MNPSTRFYLKPLFRKWIYGVAVSGSGVALVYEWIDASQFAIWNALFAAVAGLAFINVDTTKPSGMPEAKGTAPYIPAEPETTDQPRTVQDPFDGL